MRIAFVLTEFPVISELFIVRQITGLLERGHDVTIFAERAPDEVHHDRIEQFGLIERTVFRPAVARAPATRLLGAFRALAGQSPRTIVSMLRTLNVVRRRRQALNLRMIPVVRDWDRAGPFDLVHAHFAPNGVYAVDLRAAGCFASPVITTFHGYDINVLPGTPAAAGYARLFTEGDAFTSNSRFLARRAVALGCPEERLQILPMGVDLPEVAASPQPADGVTRVLTVARLAEEKGLRDAIAAVGRLTRAGVPVCYQIIGTGPLEAELRATIAEEGLADIVTLFGAASEAEVREALRESDLFLLPSVRADDGSEEAQGLALQEAQAMSVPVIATDIGGISEGVDDGRSGFLVPPHDVEGLTARLAEACRDPALRARMGDAGRRLVKERFDIEKLNDRLVDLYRETIGRAR